MGGLRSLRPLVCIGAFRRPCRADGSSAEDPCRGDLRCRKDDSRRSNRSASRDRTHRVGLSLPRAKLDSAREFRTRSTTLFQRAGLGDRVAVRCGASATGRACEPDAVVGSASADGDAPGDHMNRASAIAARGVVEPQHGAATAHHSVRSGSCGSVGLADRRTQRGANGHGLGRCAVVADSSAAQSRRDRGCARSPRSSALRSSELGEIPGRR